MPRQNHSSSSFDSEVFIRPQRLSYIGALLLVFFGVFIQPLRVDIVDGVLFLFAGVLMLFGAPKAKTPWIYGGLLLALMCCISLAWLPLDWSILHASWRQKLSQVGLPIGNELIIQKRHAFESTLVMVSTIVFAYTLSCFRATNSQVKNLSLAFSLGVAGYAIISEIYRPELRSLIDISGQYGFFNNRNHTGTFLAMGGLVGLGCLFQAAKDGARIRAVAAAAAAVVCYWALIVWSISRGGLIVGLLGIFVWLIILQVSGLNKKSKWIMLISLLALLGGYAVSDSAVKNRINTTFDRVELNSTPNQEQPLKQTTDLDFRLPVWRDTMRMIMAAPVTGFGPGQFEYLFPFYRNETLVVNDADCLHPESDWLWFAAECGLPAMIVLFAIVVYAIARAAVRIRISNLRGLRWACLMAAIIVAVHGVFDVPGHRQPILWSAIFLYTLALPLPRNGEEKSFKRLLFCHKLPGLLVLGFGLFFLLGVFRVVPCSAIALTEDTSEEVRELIRQSKEPVNLADPNEPPLHIAIQKLTAELQVLPLNRFSYLTLGTLKVNYTEYYSQAGIAFSEFLELSPLLVKAPLHVANAYYWLDEPLDEDVPHILRMWEMARARAQELDAKFVVTPSFSTRVERLIQSDRSRSKKLKSVSNENR